MTQSATRRLWLLGPVRVDQVQNAHSEVQASAADAVPRFRSRRTVGLLGYLAAERRPVARDLLAALFWPDEAPSKGRANLSRELHNLTQVLPDCWELDRQAVAFVPAANTSVDLYTLLDLEAQERWGEAAELLGGEFLEGLYLDDNLEFESWLLGERERWRRRAEAILTRVIEGHTRRGQYSDALRHTRRLLQLTPWNEEAHQQAMRLLAWTGQRGAALRQFEACRQALWEELGVEPAEETVTLHAQIQAGELDIPPQLPAFLTAEGARLEVDRPLFVAREPELSRLDAFLNTALNAKGQVVFITGGPGRGKTALMAEFARRAMDKHADLLVAMGNCNAYSGVGDPYLPFRDIMHMLTGDVEARWAAGAITCDHARRLWAAMPLTARALMDRGTSLIDVFVSGADLQSRVAAATPGATDGLQHIAASTPANLKQGQLFEQYTSVLCTVAERHPLLLLLDDVQWADSAACGLLFHLGRRLANLGARVLIACAYRPEEVALGHPASGPSSEKRRDRHPLEKALAEFKRQYGDVWVDLGHVTESDNEAFVEALLESEPNLLGPAFRTALLQHTGGHPLFTIELLRAMQERGDLVQDERGRWTEGPALDWKALPPRVEGAIEARVDRLGEALREILTVASVEGEEFTAQVVAQVLEIDERQLLRALSQELGKRHRLVREQHVIPLDGRRLARYRFRHVLFQGYLYNDLGDGERTLLHREIAAALEELYAAAGRGEEIAVQLVHHYAETGDSERERVYARLAGERAAAEYANEEALHYLNRALDLAPETDLSERYALLLAREEVHSRTGDRQAQTQDLEALEMLVDILGDDRRRAEVALGRSRYGWFTNAYPMAVAAAKRAVHLAQLAQDPRSEAAGQLGWGRGLEFSGSDEAARPHYEMALALAQAGGFHRVEASSLRNLGNLHLFDAPRTARTYLEQALRVHREIGDRMGEAAALNSIGLVLKHRGDLATARTRFEEALGIYRQVGARPGQAMVLSNLSATFQLLGEFAAARVCGEQSLAIAQDIGDQFEEATALHHLGKISCAEGDYLAAKESFEQALDLYGEIAHRSGPAMSLTLLGRASHFLGDYTQAREQCEEALSVHREFPNPWIRSHAPANLALAHHDLGDDEAARECSLDALSVAEDNHFRDDEARARTLLGLALEGLGRLSEAADSFQRALDIRRDSNQPHLAAEPLAGLARVALEQDDPARALAHVEGILRHLETGHIDDTDEPLRIYLTCYRVLQACDDARAGDVLGTSYHLLHKRARIDDEELRCAFLENVVAHREIQTEWEEQGA